MCDHLLILGDRAGIHWVLDNRRMAFPEGRAAVASRLAQGGRLFLYSTRSAWHNPTRDRGRVFGLARVASPVQRLAVPVEVAGRTFTSGCRLDQIRAVPYRSGVDLARLVPFLEAFPNKEAWSARLRTVLLPLSHRDSQVIYGELEPDLRPLKSVVDGYRRAVAPGRADPRTLR